MDGLFSVRGRSVLITGGSSGLGLHLVRLFMRHGAKVASVATQHDAAVCESLVAGIRFERPCFIKADLREDTGIRSAFEEATAAHGTPLIVFNNAGVSLRRRFADVTRQDWNRVADINLQGMFFVAQEAARRMTADGAGGSIINMTSILASRAMTGTSVYSTIKAGVSQMTRSLAFELAPQGIRVNAIAPGWFETRMTAEFLTGGAKTFLKSVNPMRRLGSEGDLDGAALLLASDAGRYMTGTVITVDGGQSLTG